MRAKQKKQACVLVFRSNGRSPRPPRRNGRTYDLVVASQTAFHFKFCQIAKLLPFTCLFLFPKSTLYFWGPHKNIRWLLSFLRKHSVSNAVRKVTNLIKKHTICGVHSLAPEIGFEPTTLWLTATCSTAELLRNINGYFVILSNWKFNVNNFTQIFYFLLNLFKINNILFFTKHPKLLVFPAQFC